MKRKVLSALLASAFVGVATTASAGVIQASYKNYAAEAFGAEVAMTAPTIGYSLALPLTGSPTNPNSFVITYTLSSGEWDPVNKPTASLVSVNNTDFLAAAVGVIDATDKKKISYAFQLDNGVTFPTGSTIVLGTNGADAGSANGKILKVYSTLQQPALTPAYCTPSTQSVSVAVKLTNAAGVEFDSNFNLAPLKNETPILQSGVATTATVLAGSALGTTTATKEVSLVDVLIGSLGTKFTGDADVTNSLTKIDLGAIVFGKNADLYDTDGVTPYAVSDADWGASVGGDGGVSQNGLVYKVTGKFVTGGTLSVTTDAAGTTALANTTVTFNTDRTEATITVTKADLSTVAAVGGKRTIYTIYTVPGDKVIPTAQFKLSTGTLDRVTASNELATPVCPGNLYNLEANGVRVDVRNYVPGVAKDATGWYSVVRVINTDEDQSASPIAQALLANGDLGATVDLTTVNSVDSKKGVFAPREVRYYTSDVIDAALNAAALANNTKTYGAADVGGNARLRITAPISSIRVQNYVFNPANGNFIEASAAQSDEGPSATMTNRHESK